MNYQSKYLKYKNKHNKLKNKINQKIIKLKKSIGKSEKPSNNDNNLIELISNLLENNSLVYLFITGKYASGKSTTSEKIKLEFEKYGVHSIELDNIIREWVVDKNDLDHIESIQDVFKINKGNGTEEETNKFINKTKESISQGILNGNKLVIIEGVLSSYSICKEIIGNNPLLTVYFQPTDKNIQKLRIISKIKSDILNNTYLIPGYWGPNGIFDREQLELDIEKEVDIEEEYKEKFDNIICQYIEDAETNAEQIQTDFTNKSWVVIIIHT